MAKVGRPTKYNAKIISKAKDYLENYEQYEEVIPSIEGLACHLHIARDTIYDWSKQDDKREFSDIVGDILSKQAKVLMNKGLVGDFNSVIAKLIMHKHGYSDKQETKIDANIGLHELTDEELAERRAKAEAELKELRGK